MIVSGGGICINMLDPAVFELELIMKL